MWCQADLTLSYAFTFGVADSGKGVLKKDRELSLVAAGSRGEGGFWMFRNPSVQGSRWSVPDRSSRRFQGAT
ncbi:hypothetical protein GCM10022420_097060 [Streptomyces iranensis]|uniref:Uncharacterized protein n=1 Tax=Streptomyces iranensis TaxID=576784 RepID=A0A061AD71_9ACTN|nr:hypothetical protein [Streptomyces iranensis]CDR17842.1 predicted protein [Streptomyces iranensis]